MPTEPSVILDVTPHSGAFETQFLESLGHPVLVCHGPDHGKACPIIKTGCAMVEGAHGVVFQLDLDRPQHRVILKRYKEVLAEDVPLWVVVNPGQEAEYEELLSGVRTVVGAIGAAELDAFAALVEATDRTA
jgi:hypothetical protein